MAAQQAVNAYESPLQISPHQPSIPSQTPARTPSNASTPYSSQSTPRSESNSSRQTSSQPTRTRTAKQRGINFEAIEQQRLRIVDSIIRSQPPPAEKPAFQYGERFDQILANPEEYKTFYLGIDNLIEVGNAVSQALSHPPQRGQREKCTFHDQFILYLIWLSTNTTQKALAESTSISAPTYSRIIESVRPALHGYLSSRFMNPPRPIVNPTFPFPEVALLVDATTIPIPTPSLLYAEKKEFYDGHHHSYCMKVEVAINPRPPFQALFVSIVVPGSVHDVNLFRQGVARYIPYLKKTAEEKLLLPADSQSDSFAIMADKGYIGNFEGVRMITPLKTRSSESGTSTPSGLPFGFPPATTQSIPDVLYTSPPDVRRFPYTIPPTPPSIASPPSTTTTSSSSSASSSSSSTSVSTINPLYPTLAAVESAAAQLADETDSLAINREIARMRIPVEWFFGRLKRLWLRLSLKYTGSREALPYDIQNACWLTNLSISYKYLTEDDGIFEERLTNSQTLKRKVRQEIQDINLDAKRKREDARRRMLSTTQSPQVGDTDSM